MIRRPVKFKRKRPTYRERYAALICGMNTADGNPVVDREWAKKATTDQIIEAFEARGKKRQWDHASPWAISGNNHVTNLTPMLKEDHAEKTKADVARIAKGKRLSSQQEEFRRKILAKAGQGEAPAPSRKKGRPMAGSKASKWKKKLNGETVRRKIIGRRSGT